MQIIVRNAKKIGLLLKNQKTKNEMVAKQELNNKNQHLVVMIFLLH